MNWTAFLSRLLRADLGTPTGRRRPPGRQPARQRCRPRLELLEDRCLLSTLTVTTSADNVATPPTGSLRAELLAAQPLDTITFAPALSGGQTITLAGALPAISSNLTISAAGVTPVTVSGNNLYQVFVINPGVGATIDSLTITAGLATTSTSAGAMGGGILNQGTLTLSNS